MSRYVRPMMRVGQGPLVNAVPFQPRFQAPLTTDVPVAPRPVRPSATQAALALLDRVRRTGQRMPIVRAHLARLMALGQRDGRTAVVDCNPYPFGPPLPVPPPPGSNDTVGQIPFQVAGPNCTLYDLPFESVTEEDMGRILPGGRILPVITPRAYGQLVPGARVTVLRAFPDIRWSYVRTIDPYMAFGALDIVGQAENPDAPPPSPGSFPMVPAGTLTAQPIEGWVRSDAVRAIEGGAGSVSRVGQASLVNVAQRLSDVRARAPEFGLPSTAIMRWIDNVKPTFEGTIHAALPSSFGPEAALGPVTGRFHPGNVLSLRRTSLPNWFELAGPMDPFDPNPQGMFVQGVLRTQGGITYLDQAARFLRPRDPRFETTLDQARARQRVTSEALPRVNPFTRLSGTCPPGSVPRRIPLRGSSSDPTPLLWVWGCVDPKTAAVIG